MPLTPKRKRGEATRGTLNAKAKLTDEAVAQARDQYRKGDSAEVLAKRFGVKSSTMHTALSGETWAHVPGAIAPSEMHPSGRRRALDNAAVVKARNLYRKGATMMALAAKFGVSLDTISHALSGETYSHVPGALALTEFRRRGRPKGSSQRERRS
jgi:lambda repressor-like predicted transcriptional regulator